MNEAANIVTRLLENDDEIDPKDFAMQLQAKTYYSTVVLMQGDDGRDMLDRLKSGGEEEAIDYLADWDDGAHGWHIDQKPWGTSDRTYVRKLPNNEAYVLSWNSALGYVSLTRTRSVITK